MVSVQAPESPVVVLVDSRDLTRVALLRSFSEALPGITVVAVADIDDLAGHTTQYLRAVVLHTESASLPAALLKSTIAAARDKLRGVPVVTLSERGDEGSLNAAIEGGASAYLTTSMPLDLAAATLRLVMVGGTSFPPRNGSRGAAPRPRGTHLRRDRTNSADQLTRREEEVLKYVGEGAQNKTIAFTLNMSENTVKVHLHRILQKFRLNNRTEAALLANRYFASGDALSAQASARGPDAIVQMMAQDSDTLPG